MTRVFLRGSLALLAGSLGAPSLLAAQEGPVVQLSYAKQLDAIGYGAGIGFSMGEMTTKTGFWGQATIDFFSVDKFTVQQPIPPHQVNHSYYEFNVNFLRVMKPVPGLYLGTGFNYSVERIDDGKYGGEEGGSNMGVSVIGGFHFGPWKQAPFVQARYELGGGKQFIVSTGLAF